MWTATVIVIILVLASSPRYQKLKCPFRVGPCARIARGIPCQQTGQPMCSLQKGGFGGHWIFHCWVVSPQSLCRSSLPSSDALQKSSALSCLWTRDIGVCWLRGCGLPSAAQDQWNGSTYSAKNPIPGEISPFSSLWWVLSWRLQLSSPRVRGLGWLCALTNDVHRTLVWTSAAQPVTSATHAEIASLGADTAKTQHEQHTMSHSIDCHQPSAQQHGLLGHCSALDVTNGREQVPEEQSLSEITSEAPRMLCWVIQLDFSGKKPTIY